MKRKTKSHLKQSRDILHKIFYENFLIKRFKENIKIIKLSYKWRSHKKEENF